MYSSGLKTKGLDKFLNWSRSASPARQGATTTVILYKIPLEVESGGYRYKLEVLHNHYGSLSVYCSEPPERLKPGEESSGSTVEITCPIELVCQYEHGGPGL